MYGFPMVSEDDFTAIVVRFSPFTESGMLKNVEKQRVRDQISGVPERLGVSVFASPREPGESVEDTVQRICNEVRNYASGERLAVASEQVLNNAGYALHLNEPPPGHYLVGKAVLTEMPDLEGLAKILSLDRRKNLAFKEG